jgi:hypothetical protein
VQDAVDQEQRYFVGKGMAVFFGLVSSGLDRDDHIAEEMGLGRRETLLLRKGQDVGGTIVVQVHLIEAPDGPIIDEEHRDLITRSAQDA